MYLLMVPLMVLHKVYCLVLHLDLLLVSRLGPTGVISDGCNDGMFEGLELIVPL